MRVKPVLCLVFCLFICFSKVYSQPDWVRDAFKKNQPIEIADANAIVLHHVQNVEITEDKTAEINVEVAYKIINSDGEEYATLTLLSSDKIEVVDLKGWLRKSNGEINQLSNENVAEFGLQESAAYHDENRQVFASFPDAEPGDCIAFEATVEENDWTCLFQNFTFQTQEPVLYAKYNIQIPEDWELIDAEWNLDEIEYEQNEGNFVWIGTNLEYRKSEPLQPSWQYLAKRLSLVVFNPQEQSPTKFKSWVNVANWCANIFKEPGESSHEIKKKMKVLTGDSLNSEEKIKAIAEYIQNEIRYVAIELGKERWQPRQAQKTYYNGYGDCKDKCTLMRAMLSTLKIESVPVLINTTTPVDWRLPTPFQFNHCIIAIRVDELDLSSSMQNAIVDKWLFFDPTDPSIQIGQISSILQGKNVVLGGHLDSVIYMLPDPDPQKFRRHYDLTGEILPNGQITAEISVISYGGWVSEDRFYEREYTTEKQIEDCYNAFSKTIPSFKILDYITTDHPDSFITQFKITGKDLIQQSGPFLLLRPDIFEPWEPTQLTAEERNSPIWFGAPMEVKKSISWKYPKDWIAKSGDNIIKSDCDGASVQMNYLDENSTIDYYSVYKQYGKLVSAKQYKMAKNFAEYLSRANGKTIIFSNE